MTPQDLFRLHPFLNVLNESESRELLAHALKRRVPASHVIFRKDDPGDGLYGVLRDVSSSPSNPGRARS